MAADEDAEREADAASDGLGGTGGRPRLSHVGHALRRVGAGEWLARFFGGGTFSDRELLAYLRRLDLEDKIEDTFESDNMARAVVVRWQQGDPRFDLTPRRKTLLVQEMISGFTGDDDEQAILAILRGSGDAEMAVILETVGEADLKSNLPRRGVG